jgi:hypothetical protein
MNFRNCAFCSSVIVMCDLSEYTIAGWFDRFAFSFGGGAATTLTQKKAKTQAATVL